MGRAGADEMLHGLHDFIRQRVALCCDGVDLADTWSIQETLKRITTYIYKAGSQREVLREPWEKAIRTFVSSAMSSYTGPCTWQRWFLEVDLRGTMEGVAWYLMQANDGSPLTRGQVNAIAAKVHDEEFIDAWLRRNIYNSVHTVFNCKVDQKTLGKIVYAVCKSRETVLRGFREDGRAPTARLDTFLKLWVEDAMGRAWSSLGEEGAADLLSEDAMVRTFELLTAPRGEAYRDTCLPLDILKAPRPEKGWPAIGREVRRVLNSWFPVRRKRSASVGRAPSPRDPSPPRKAARAEVRTQRHDEEPRGRSPLSDGVGSCGAGDAAGHPSCIVFSLGEPGECQGSEGSGLVQHLLHGKTPRDVYCDECWEYSLLERPRMCMKRVTQPRGRQQRPTADAF